MGSIPGDEYGSGLSMLAIFWTYWGVRRQHQRSTFVTNDSNSSALIEEADSHAAQYVVMPIAVCKTRPT